MTAPPPEFMEVGFVNEHEELSLLHISFDALAIARARGWMVWGDLVRAATRVTAPQGDGDDGR